MQIRQDIRLNVSCDYDTAQQACSIVENELGFTTTFFRDQDEEDDPLRVDLQKLYQPIAIERTVRGDNARLYNIITEFKLGSITHSGLIMIPDRCEVTSD